MPSQSPIRPKLLKGALAVYPSHAPGAVVSQVIVFQFNPESVKRTLAHRASAPPDKASSPGAAKEDVLRVAGPPIETISMTVDMHASDQLAEPQSNSVVAEHGLHPALATLELLMYPSTMDSRKIEQLAAAGQVQVTPADLPLVLLLWGKSRVVPVKITSFSVSEDAFDSRLNPISAKVELAMQVLSHIEFPASSVGRDAFIAYQKSKEALARSGALGSVDSVLRDLLPF